MAKRSSSNNSGCATFVGYCIVILFDIGVLFVAIAAIVEILSSNVLIPLLIGVFAVGFVAVVIFRNKKEEQKKNHEQFVQMTIDNFNNFQKSAETAKSSTQFVHDWNQMIEYAKVLYQLGDSVQYTNGFSPAAFLRNAQIDFQWKLRNAIERMETQSIGRMRNTFANSREHREREYTLFCSDLDQVYGLFTDETKEFADAAAKRVYSAANTTMQQHSTYSHSTTRYLANPQIPQSAEIELQKIDNMDGHDFEYWCARLLQRNGFQNVSVTQGSGDQGVDVLAEKDGIKYAVQCKCYSHDLGNTPIQEVHSGRDFYHCHIGAVMTNRYFTQGAVDAAKATHILLWDRDKIIEMLKSANERT